MTGSVKALMAMAAAAVLTGCGSTELRNSATTESSSHPMVTGDARQTGDVKITNDAEYLYVEFTVEPGFEISVAEACIATVAFEWVDPSTCQYRRTINCGPGSKVTISAPLAHFGLDATSLEGTTLHLQVHTRVVDDRKSEITGGAYGGSFKGQVDHALHAN